MHNLELWATNIGNAYLKTFTSKKLYIITSPEFRELEGHMLVHHLQGTIWFMDKQVKVA